MEAVLTPTNQTIHLSSAGRSAVLAQYLTADRQQAAAIAAWLEQLVASATTLGIALNTHDVRTLLPEPIEQLEDVIKKSHPAALRGYGRAVEPSAALLLERWCADARACIDVFSRVWLGATPALAVSAANDGGFPTTLPLAKYQRMALATFLQVGTDTLAVLNSVLQIARRPYAPLFRSSLRGEDLCRCDGACQTLAALFAVAQCWVVCQPEDGRPLLVAEQLRQANTAVSLLFEGLHDQGRRTVLRDLLIRLSMLRRDV